MKVAQPDRSDPPPDRWHESDSELVRRCRTELPYNTAAFEALVSRYETRVFRTCRHYLGSDADAEEVTQDVFLRVFRGLHSFAEKASFSTWLFRIVHNECATRYSKIKRRAEGREEYRRHRMSEPPLAQPEPSQASALGDRVQETLSGLPDDDRQVLVLRYVGDLSLKEVARAMGIKLSAAKMRLYRAQQRFRERHEESGPTVGPPP